MKGINPILGGVMLVATSIVVATIVVSWLSSEKPRLLPYPGVYIYRIPALRPRDRRHARDNAAPHLSSRTPHADTITTAPRRATNQHDAPWYRKRTSGRAGST